MSETIERSSEEDLGLSKKTKKNIYRVLFVLVHLIMYAAIFCFWRTLGGMVVAVIISTLSFFAISIFGDLF
ncbi:hypothetical protein E0494_06655 [Marinilabiliaceae bacterium JC040]|nr:hypothetical protein [Marinilabiliaceae bacterium JC040]